MAIKNANAVENTASHRIHFRIPITIFVFLGTQHINKRMMLKDANNPNMSNSRNNLRPCFRTASPSLELPSKLTFVLGGVGPPSSFCLNPPGGFSPAWNVTVAINVATNISVAGLLLYLSLSSDNTFRGLRSSLEGRAWRRKGFQRFGRLLCDAIVAEALASLGDDFG